MTRTSTTRRSTEINEAANRQNIIDAKGATVRELSPEQRAEWVSTMKPVWQQVPGTTSVKDLIDAAVASNQQS